MIQRPPFSWRDAAARWLTETPLTPDAIQVLKGLPKNGDYVFQWHGELIDDCNRRPRMEKLDRITQRPEIMGGKAAGRSVDELLAEYPYLERVTQNSREVHAASTLTVPVSPPSSRK
jgi:hypothetical protein